MDEWPPIDRWLETGVLRGIVLGAIYGGGTGLWTVVVDGQLDGAVILAVAFGAAIGGTLGLFIGSLTGLLLGWVSGRRRFEGVTPNLFALAGLAVVGAAVSIGLVLATADVAGVLYVAVGPAVLGLASLLIRPFTGKPPTVKNLAP